MLQFKWLIFHGHHRFEHIPSLNLLVIFGANFFTSYWFFLPHDRQCQSTKSKVLDKNKHCKIEQHKVQVKFNNIMENFSEYHSIFVAIN